MRGNTWPPIVGALAVVALLAQSAFAQQHPSESSKPPDAPVEAPTAETPTADKSSFFVSALSSYVLSYDTDLQTPDGLGLNSRKAKGNGYGGIVGFVDSQGGVFGRAEYFPQIIVPSNGPFELRTRRWDADLHFLAGNNSGTSDIHVLYDFGFKYVNVNDLFLDNVDPTATGDQRGQQWYLGSLGLNLDWRIGGPQSPLSVFGGANGMLGWANVNGTEVSNFTSSFIHDSGGAYGWTGTAGVGLSFFKGALKFAAGYKIQQILAFSGKNQDSNDVPITIASDKLQSLFAQLTFRF